MKEAHDEWVKVGCPLDAARALAAGDDVDALRRALTMLRGSAPWASGTTPPAASAGWASGTSRGRRPRAAVGGGRRGCAQSP